MILKRKTVQPHIIKYSAGVEGITNVMRKLVLTAAKLYFVKYSLDRLMLAGNIGIVNPSITNATHYPDTGTSVTS